MPVEGIPAPDLGAGCFQGRFRRTGGSCSRDFARHGVGDYWRVWFASGSGSFGGILATYLNSHVRINLRIVQQGFFKHGKMAPSSPRPRHRRARTDFTCKSCWSAVPFEAFCCTMYSSIHRSWQGGLLCNQTNMRLRQGHQLFARRLARDLAFLPGGGGLTREKSNILGLLCLRWKLQLPTAADHSSA